MDDGFQNPGLHKDLSLLVIDGDYGIGNGSLLPAGPLREPIENALARAQAVVQVGGSPESLTELGIKKDMPFSEPFSYPTRQQTSFLLNASSPSPALDSRRSFTIVCGVPAVR